MFRVAIYAWSIWKNFKMGCCYSKKVVIPEEPSIQQAEARLANPAGAQYLLKDFARDMLIAHADQVVTMTITVELVLFYNDDSTTDIEHLLKFTGIVTKYNLNSLRLRLRVFMAAPYYYHVDYTMFYTRVCCCKLYCIKNIVIE